MAALLFGVFLVALLVGIPVAFAIMLAAMAVMTAGDVGLGMIAQRMFASTNSFPLIAVPFFILAGDLLAQGAISKYLVEFAESFLGMIKGGLSIVSVVTGMFFAAISGSGAATTAAVGSTLIPQLKERGYDEDSAAALIAAGGNHWCSDSAICAYGAVCGQLRRKLESVIYQWFSSRRFDGCHFDYHCFGASV